MIAPTRKILTITAVIIGLGQLTIKQSTSSTQYAHNKHNKHCSSICAGSKSINPSAIAILSKTLSNLDKTVNTGEGFDYWPNGGIQIAYYHLATFLSYKTISGLSPHAVFLSGPHGTVNLNLNSSQTFGYYNPKFLRWLQDHLIEILGDRRFTEITRGNFQTYLSNTAQTYWATYTILNQYPDELNALLEDYQQRLSTRSVPDSYYYNIAWQENSEQYKSLSKLRQSYDTNVIAPAVYFWLRRSIDGTEGQVFSMLEYILNAYQNNQPKSLYRDTEELPIPNSKLNHE